MPHAGGRGTASFDVSKAPLIHVHSEGWREEGWEGSQENRERERDWGSNIFMTKCSWPCKQDGTGNTEARE